MNLLQKLFPTAWQPQPDTSMGYSLDLDGSLRYTRFEEFATYEPWVGGDGTIAQIGMVNGFMRQQDVLVWDQMFGKTPSGPGVNSVPINLQWQITIAGLGKMG